MKRMKVLYATNTPSHYKVGMLDSLQRLFPGLLVLFLAKKDYIRKWKNPLLLAKHRYVEEKSLLLPIKALELSQMISLGAILRYFKYDPEVVVIGPYSQITLFTIGLLAAIRRQHLVIWYESHAQSGIRYGLSAHLFGLFRRLVLQTAHAVVVPGVMARDHCVQLGVNPSRLYVAPHSIDNNRFANAFTKRIELSEQPQTEFRYIYVGRFTRGKNVLGVIDAFSEVRAHFGQVRLTLIGGERNELPDELPLGVSVLDFVEPEAIPDVLADHDALVLASTNEVWGLVVNEACAAGCPVIVTRCCGAAEIVEDGVNGYVVSPDDKGDLVRAMSEIYGKRSEMNRRLIRDRICTHYKFDNMANGFAEAILRKIENVSMI